MSYNGFQPGAVLNAQAFGNRPENVEVPVLSNSVPGAQQYFYPIGKHWINMAANAVYVLTSVSTSAGISSATWSLLGTNGGPLNTLTDDANSAVTPVSNNIKLAGTASQITTTASAGTITFALASSLVVPGSLTTTTTLSVGTNATVGGTLGVTGTTTLAAVGATNGTFSGTLGVTGTTTLGALTQVGTANINNSGAATTNIGVSGTGAVNIGNATGNTTIPAGNLVLTLGNVTVTAGNITATAGNIVATSGTVTGGAGLIATSGGVTATAGDITANGGDIITTRSAAGADVTVEATNSDNTNGASRAGVEIATGGASSGDPYLSFQISGVAASTMTMGLDNSASDVFVISNSTAIGTSNALTLTQAGALTTTSSITATAGGITATSGNITATAGNVIVNGAAKQFQCHGGAVTDFIGQVTLTAGEADVLNTNIAAGDRVIVTRSAKNASTAYGTPLVTITAATKFNVTACKSDTTKETNDVSTFDYVIIRQV